MTIRTRPHAGSLRFDGHELLRYLSRVPGRRWWLEALAGEATLDNPVPVERSLTTMARDGVRTVIDRYENRSPSFQVIAVAVDATGLAEAERALFLSCQRPTTLEWTPPSGLGATTQYEVQTARLAHRFDFVAESGTGELRRSYLLTLNASPFGRSVDRVTIDFPAGVASPVLTTLDEMTATTGWETDARPQIGETDALFAGTEGAETYLEVRWRSDLDGVYNLRKPTPPYACDDYVMVEWASTTTTPLGLLVDGQRVDSIGSTTVRPGTASEATAEVFFVGSGSHTLGLAWDVKVTTNIDRSGIGSSYGAGEIRFYDISTTDDLPQGLARRVRVEGSARGPWSVRASDPTFEGAPGLGPTLLAVGPRVGTYNPLISTEAVFNGTSVTFGALPGSYALIAIIDGTTSETGSGSGIGIEFTFNGQSHTVASTSRIQVLGRLDFGGSRGGRPAAASVTMTTTDATLAGDLLLIPVDDDHSFVLGDYTGDTYLFCDPATLTSRGGVFSGDQPDGSDSTPAYTSTLISQPLEVEPGEAAIYVYPLYADIQISGYPYWHTHAGPVADA